MMQTQQMLLGNSFDNAPNERVNDPHVRDGLKKALKKWYEIEEIYKEKKQIAAKAPAPFSTVTVRPRSTNFFTVSGEAATRVSLGHNSFNMAIFIDAVPG